VNTDLCFDKTMQTTEASRLIASSFCQPHGFDVQPILSFCEKYQNDETSEHMRRVGILSALLGAAIGRPSSELTVLRVGAPLHDIGKIAVPDQILTKNGKLSAAELQQMKSHTLIGSRILEGSQSAVLQVASQIALSHHERWDGGGYPRGLAGDAIPLAARIVAIADVFDALTHNRPYKRAWELSQAIEAIELGRGRQFDPTLVPAFFGLLQAEGLQKLAARIDAEGRSIGSDNSN
jgi:putative two-component system response regulator